VSYSLLAITILVFLAQMISQQLLGTDLPAMMGMKVNDLIAEGQLWRLITPVFLHGGILHIGFNMYALFILGPGLERYFGHGRFIALYFVSAFAGNVLSFIFSPAPSLGSSTAIFGLLGAQGVFVYRNREVFGGFARRALTNVLWIAGVNLVIGLTPGIDNWGHLGGLIGGTIFAWLGGPLLVLQGVAPTLSVVDKRETRDWVLAAIGDAALFAFLAAVTLFMRY
jgi:rhomboid protease GluP